MVKRGKTTAMGLTAQGVMGVHSAALTLIRGQALEVVGPNNSGKTSVAIAAQAVLAQQPNPLSLTAAEAKQYLNESADPDEARVVLELLDEGYVTGEVVWRPARGTVEAPPTMPGIPGEAVGLVDFCARKSAKERARSLQSILLPPDEEVLDAARDVLAEWLHDDDLDGVIQLIADEDWESAHKIYAERARKTKQQWEKAAGRRYGVKVAADWRPDGWHADWDQLSVQAAEERKVDARDALDLLHQDKAVSEAEAAHAAEAQAQLPDAQERCDKAQELLEQAQEMDGHSGRLLADAVDKARTASAHLARCQQEQAVLAAVTSLACPHCDGPLMIEPGSGVDEPGRIVAFDMEVWRSMHDKAVADAEEAERALAAADKELGDARTSRGVTAEALEACREERRNADADLVALKASAAKGGPVQTEEALKAIADAEQQVEAAVEVHRMVQARQTAADLHDTITRYTAVAKQLGPEGVRAKMLERGLRRLNDGLGALCETAGWPGCQVSELGAVSWGGRSAQLCSESERWRAQALIQLTLGAIAGAEAIVLDRADLLDADNRAGMAAAVDRAAQGGDLAVLICATGTPDADAAWPQIVIEDGRIG